MNEAGQVGGVSVFFKRSICAGGSGLRGAWGGRSVGRLRCLTPCPNTTSTSCDRARRAAASHERAARRSPSANTEGKPPMPEKEAAWEKSTEPSRPWDEPSPPQLSPAPRYPARNSPKSPPFGWRWDTYRASLQLSGRVKKLHDPSAGPRHCARIYLNSQRN